MRGASSDERREVKVAEAAGLAWGLGSLDQHVEGFAGRDALGVAAVVACESDDLPVGRDGRLEIAEPSVVDLREQKTSTAFEQNTSATS